MSKGLTTKELEKMSLADLQKEVAILSNVTAKMRMSMGMGSEKDSAKYKRQKKQIAQINTEITKKRAAEPLPQNAKEATVSAPRSSDAKRASTPKSS